MNHTPIYFSRYDYTKLRLLLSTTLYSSAHNAAHRKLREELDRAAVLDPAVFPADVVTLDSTVTFEDLATGEFEEYTITFPERADVDSKRISILAPIGTALIGCRVGDIVKWATPGGIRKLKVRHVTPPAGASLSVTAPPSLALANATA